MLVFQRSKRHKNAAAQQAQKDLAYSLALSFPEVIMQPTPLLLHPMNHSSRLHACSAVDAEDLAVDPLAVLRSEEADDTSNVDGETNTVQGRPASSELEEEKSACQSGLKFSRKTNKNSPRRHHHHPA